MIYIGCHLSVSDGYEAMGRKMVDFGGNTFAWFTRNPRGDKPEVIGINLDEHGWADVSELIEGVRRTHPIDMETLLIHDRDRAKNCHHTYAVTCRNW